MSDSQSKLPTPQKCTADFCLIPMGTPTPSVSVQIAEIQKLIRKSGIKYTMHSAGTTLEGQWDEVCHLIGQAHSLLHEQGILRIQTDIRIGSRIDKVQSAADKIEAVERLLANDSKLDSVDAAVKSGIDEPEDAGAPLAS